MSKRFHHKYALDSLMHQTGILAGFNSHRSEISDLKSQQSRCIARLGNLSFKFIFFQKGGRAVYNTMYTMFLFVSLSCLADRFKDSAFPLRVLQSFADIRMSSCCVSFALEQYLQLESHKSGPRWKSHLTVAMCVSLHSQSFAADDKPVPPSVPPPRPAANVALWAQYLFFNAGGQ